MAVRDPSDFDDFSESYGKAVEDSIAFSGADHEFFTRVKVRELLHLAARRVGDPARLSFADIGCGPGETDRFLERRVATLSGVDVSQEMVETAKLANPWAEYRVTRTGGALPFPAGEFDVAFTICVLHHVHKEQRASLLAEMARITKPGGLVAIFEHNPRNPLTRRAVSSCEFDRDAVLLPRDESERLLSQAGLLSIEGSYIVFFTRESRPLQRIERLLGFLPLGAQYVVSACQG